MSNQKRLKRLLQKTVYCFYCQCRVRKGRPNTHHMGMKDLSTVDHVVPRNLSGTNADFNLVLSCEDCNTNKQNTSELMFANNRKRRGFYNYPAYKAKHISTGEEL